MLAWFNLCANKYFPTYDHTYSLHWLLHLTYFTYERSIANPYHTYGSQYFFTIDQNSFLVFSLIIYINQHSVKQLGEQWAGWDGVRQVSVICLMSDAVFYLPHLFVVDDKGAVVEDDTLCHDLFYCTI